MGWVWGCWVVVKRGGGPPNLESNFWHHTSCFCAVEHRSSTQNLSCQELSNLTHRDARGLARAQGTAPNMLPGWTRTARQTGEATTYNTHASKAGGQVRGQVREKHKMRSGLEVSTGGQKYPWSGGETTTTQATAL